MFFLVRCLNISCELNVCEKSQTKLKQCERINAVLQSFKMPHTRFSFRFEIVDNNNNNTRNKQNQKKKRHGKMVIKKDLQIDN